MNTESGLFMLILGYSAQILFGLGVLIVFGCWIIPKSMQEFRNAKMNKIYDILTRSHVRFVSNIQNDVIAVCRFEATTRAYTNHLKKVEKGELKSWDKVVLYAMPTFVFAGSIQTFRPIHTGLRVDLERILAKVIFDLTGKERSFFSNSEFEVALKIIVVRDERLYVPFSNPKMGEEDNERYFGGSNMEQAKVAISI